MDLIAALRTFVRVSEMKSFSAVAAERGVTQPAISRQVSTLEEHLGLRLVHRTTQSVTLTEEGRQFRPAAIQMIDAADAMVDMADQRRSNPIGTVRVATHVCFGLYVSKLLPMLLRTHDQLAVDLVVRDKFGGLVEEGLDLEVRLGAPVQTATIMRRVGYTNALLVASPDYLRGREVPKHPEDLVGHECVHHTDGNDGNVWHFRKGEAVSEADEFAIPAEVSGRFSSNHSSTVHNATLAGQGVAALPHYQVADDILKGRLVHLLPGYRRSGWPIFVCYPTKRSLPPRTRTVIDFLVAILERDPGMEHRDPLQHPGLDALRRLLPECAAA